MALLSSFSFSFTTITLPRTQTPCFYPNYPSPKFKIPNFSQSNTLVAFSASKLNNQIASDSTPDLQHQIQTRTFYTPFVVGGVSSLPLLLLRFVCSFLSLFRVQAFKMRRNLFNDTTVVGSTGNSSSTPSSITPTSNQDGYLRNKKNLN